MDFISARVKNQISDFKKSSFFEDFQKNNPIAYKFCGIIITAIVIALIGLAFTRFTSSDPQYRTAVLKELQNARNDLDLALTAFELNWGYDLRRFKGPVYKDKIPHLFSSDQELCDEILSLYDLFNSAKVSTEKIDELLRSKILDKESIEIHKKVIQSTIERADIIGRKVAEKLDKKWITSPSSLPFTGKMGLSEQ